MTVTHKLIVIAVCIAIYIFIAIRDREKLRKYKKYRENE